MCFEQLFIETTPGIQIDLGILPDGLGCIIVRIDYEFSDYAETGHVQGIGGASSSRCLLHSTVPRKIAALVSAGTFGTVFVSSPNRHEKLSALAQTDTEKKWFGLTGTPLGHCVASQAQGFFHLKGLVKTFIVTRFAELALRERKLASYGACLRCCSPRVQASLNLKNGTNGSSYLKCAMTKLGYLEKYVIDTSPTLVGYSQLPLPRFHTRDLFGRCFILLPQSVKPPHVSYHTSASRVLTVHVVPLVSASILPMQPLCVECSTT